MREEGSTERAQIGRAEGGERAAYVSWHEAAPRRRTCTAYQKERRETFSTFDRMSSPYRNSTICATNGKEGKELPEGAEHLQRLQPRYQDPFCHGKLDGRIGKLRMKGRGERRQVVDVENTYFHG